MMEDEGFISLTNIEISWNSPFASLSLYFIETS